MSETPEEKAERLGVMLIPKREPQPIAPNGIIAVCGECGLEIYQIMGYVCPRGRNCPASFGGM